MKQQYFSKQVQKNVTLLIHRTMINFFCFFDIVQSLLHLLQIKSL